MSPNSVRRSEVDFVSGSLVNREEPNYPEIHDLVFGYDHLGISVEFDLQRLDDRTEALLNETLAKRVERLLAS
jgi:hypothetical protein